MSITIPARGMVEPRSLAPAMWQGALLNPKTINEGQSLTIRFNVINFVPGQSRIIWWMSGGAVSTSRWLRSWQSVIEEAMTKNGLECKRLTASTVPNSVGSLDMLISVPLNTTYQGQDILVTNTTRLNRRNDTDPTTGQMLLLARASSRISGSTADPDLTRVSGSNLVSINDTSKRPLYTPTYSVRVYDRDGFSAPKNVLNPGDGVQLVFDAQHVIPGTKIKVYAANKGQNMLSPAFRSAFLTALRNAPPGITFEQTRYPPPEGQSFYNGYTIVYGEEYDDTNPLMFNLTVGNNVDDENASQLDIISTVTQEGTAADFDSYKGVGDWVSDRAYARGEWITYIPTGVKYIALQAVAAGIEPTNETYWREYIPIQMIGGAKTFTLRAKPPRYFEVRAKRNGDMIDYALEFPAEAAGATVDLYVENAPAGFYPALEAACAVAGSPCSYDNGKLTVTDKSTKAYHSVRFSVPFSGSGTHRLELRNEQGSYVGIRYACVFLTPVEKPVDPIFTVGVNLSTAEFGSDPGVYGTDYMYPSRPELTSARKHENMDYLWGLGVRMIRLPIKWGRIQREYYGPLYGERAPGDPWRGSLDIARVDEIIDYWCNTLGGTCGVDIHNFGSGISGGRVRYDPELDETGKSVPVEAFIDLWLKLANRWAYQPKVWFFLMNEPNGSAAWSPTRCRSTFQSTMNAIRSLTPARNKILVPACEWSHTANFVANGQAEVYEDLYDPADNFAVEIHNYFNPSKSGAGADAGVCVPNGEKQLDAAIAWGAATGIKLFMGEIAGGDPNVEAQKQCGSVVPAAYRKMTAAKGNPMLGWTTWGYGPWWPASYPFSLNPTDYQTPSAPSPNMAALIPFITHQYPPKE